MLVCIEIVDMESFENSVICHYSGSKKISIPAANVNIKQEVDVQDIYIKEETHKQGMEQKSE